MTSPQDLLKHKHSYQMCILHRLHPLRRTSHGLQHRFVYTKDPRLAFWSMLSKSSCSGHQDSGDWQHSDELSQPKSRAAARRSPLLLHATLRTWWLAYTPNLLRLSLSLCSLFTSTLSLSQGLEAGLNNSKQRTGCHRGCHKGSWASDQPQHID